jgi:hypothetical protein
VVRVAAGGQGAGDVADDLEGEADGERDKVPAAVADDEGGVGEEQEGEPDDCEDGEGEGGRVAVDDDGSVPGAVGVGEMGVDVAVDGWEVLVHTKLSR